MIVLYGIPNCDTIKKARRWLQDHGVDYRFHDYKKAGIDAQSLKSWCREFGLDAVLNRRGTTWRKLDDSIKDNINEAGAIALMQEQPSIIKRPMLVSGKKRILGFDEADYKCLL